MIALRPAVRVRNGIPRFVRRAAAGEPQSAVAFGTSMTLFGHYLAALPAALRTALPQAPIAFAARGLRGFGSWQAAFRVDEVLADVPDLVVLEFAHNEQTAGAVAMIGASVAGIIAQIRAVRPSCEFVFATLAPPGLAATGPTPAMTAWEALADALGIATIDVATFAEGLVASGRACWTGAPDALTTDGVHYGEPAARAIGEPFAASFVELIDASRSLPERELAVPASPYAHCLRAPAEAFVCQGQWGFGLPDDHERRTADAYGERATVALAGGAQLLIPFVGSDCFAWVRGRGSLTFNVDGFVLGPVAVDQLRWEFNRLVPETLTNGAHELVVIASEGLVFGDVNIVGRR